MKGNICRKLEPVFRVLLVLAPHGKCYILKSMQKTSNVRELEEICRKIRRHIVTMITEAKSGHPGGSLSAVEIVTTLFYDVMRHDPANPTWAERDKFILSKGHAAPVLYAALAEAGYFGRDHLLTLRKLGSMLQGHPDCKKTPGVEVSTGSLGQGLSIAAGLAAGLRGGEQFVTCNSLLAQQLFVDQFAGDTETHLGLRSQSLKSPKARIRSANRAGSDEDGAVSL